MAGTKKTLNPLTDKPEVKTDITKKFMLAYMKSEKATPADIEWFKGVISNPANQKEYINHLNNQPYTDIDVPKVRKEFGLRFYPYLYEEKKGTKTFIDTIMGL